MIGSYVETDLTNGVGWGRCLRVRAIINIDKPLLRGMNIKGMGGLIFIVFFKYERLPHFGYYCGRFGHGERECLSRMDSSIPITKGPMQFGAWLRAPMGRGLKSITGQKGRQGKNTGGEDRWCFSEEWTRIFEAISQK